MAVSITDLCVSCHACFDVCPNDAIYQARDQFMVNKNNCTECVGDHDDPQCASICPVECCILDADGTAFNPLGSLTGIPVDKILEYQALQAAMSAQREA